MNGRSDMLRQQGIAQLTPNILSLDSQQFLPTRQQPGQPSQPSNHLGGLVPGAGNVGPQMGLLGGGQSNSGVSHYPLQIQAGQHRQQQHMFQQGHGSQPMPTSSNPQGPRMGGMPGHNQMTFSGNMMQQAGGNPPLRRVASQPQPLNQATVHMENIHPGQSAGAVGGVNMQMFQGQPNMPAHLRQIPGQQLRLQQQQIQGQLSPDVPILGRPGNAGPANVARSASAQAQASAQLMGSLPHPPTLTQAHSNGIQTSLLPNNFSSPLPLTHQHQQNQPSASPRPSGLHAQNPAPPNIPMSTPALPQTVNRSQHAPDNGMFLSFPNQQTSLQSYHHPRVPSNTPQFPFMSGSPTSHGDGSQVLPGGIDNPSSSNRPGFLSTPAQQMEQMHPFNTSHFNMPPPARPPSHTNHEPLSLSQLPTSAQHSPRLPDPINQHSLHPSRPQSQPQASSGRPPSQAGLSSTPRVGPPLPGNPGLLSAGRIQPPLQPQPPPQSSGHSIQLPIAPRPSVLSTTSGTSGPPSGLPPTEGPNLGPTYASQRPMPLFPGGQALTRLLQFSGILAEENKTKLQLTYWDLLVKEFFTQKAIMRFTLWKDNHRNEAKPFEIGIPILPRFFLVTTQSGVKSMTLSLDGARERVAGNGHAVVECVNAIWTYKYSNGYTVTLRGPLTAHVHMLPIAHMSQNGSAPPSQSGPQQLSHVFRFDDLQFDANFHDKFIALESVLGPRVFESPKTPRARNASTPTANCSTAAQQRAEEDKKSEEPRVIIEHASFPGEPVNAFGIPQATMRCLELAESVGIMADLISFSSDAKLGPIEALARFAEKVRDSSPHLIGQTTGNPGQLNGAGSTGSGNFSKFSTANSMAASPAVTLMNPISHPHAAPPTSSPQNPSTSADNSPQKQHKTIPPPQSAPPQPPASTPSSAPVPTGSNTTPLMVNATLKRKQETASPTLTNAEQPPQKRMARKRRTTGSG